MEDRKNFTSIAAFGNAIARAGKKRQPINAA
jgi:hypothetical protein